MQTIRLSTTPGAVNPGAYLSQYDVGRQILIMLYDDTGKYIPSAGSTVHIRATKPSGFGFDVGCIWSQNSVTVTVTEEMSNESGSFAAELRIEKDGNILGTANFLWNVERSTHLNGTVDGNTEARGLMQDILDAISDAEAAAAEARAAAGAGMTDDLKEALLQIAEKAVYIDAGGQQYYDDLYNALYPPVPATGITLNKSAIRMLDLGDEETLVATVTPADTSDTVVWESSDPDIATVDQNGKVTAIDYGSTTITATAGSVSATCAIAVAALSSITAVFTQGGQTIYSDDTLDSLKQYLTVTATYSDGETEEVPAEDYTLSGTLTVGTSTITVTYEEETDTFEVTVTQAVTRYTITNNLTHVASSNPKAIVEENESFTTSLGIQTGYTLLSVSVTMGGVDVTEEVYNTETRQISIAAVTGNVILTAAAVMTPASISAVFTQGDHTVYPADDINTLKPYLVVTATYSDSSTAVIPSTDYALSGTLSPGTSTVTVTYAGATATFSVTVSIIDVRDIEPYFVSDVEDAMDYVQTLGTTDWVHHIVVTDTHFRKNYGHSTPIVKAMQDTGYFGKVIHLGDITDDGTQSNYEAAAENYSQFNGDMLFAIGNHDNLFTGYEQYWYDAFLSDDTDITTTPEDIAKFNYYWDDADHSIRYIVYGYSSTSGGAAYAIDKIKSAPAGYAIITLCHYKALIESTILIPLIGHELEYIGGIAGHYHIDGGSHLYADMYNETWLNNDGWANDDASYPKTDGTVDSQVITIMSINTTTRVVKFYRIGIPTALGQNWQYTYVKGGSVEEWLTGGYWGAGSVISNANGYISTKKYPVYDANENVIQYYIKYDSGTGKQIAILSLDGNGDYNNRRQAPSTSEVWNYKLGFSKFGTPTTYLVSAIVENLADTDDLTITDIPEALEREYSSTPWETGFYLNSSAQNVTDADSATSMAFDILPNTTYKFTVDDADWAGSNYFYAFLYTHAWNNNNQVIQHATSRRQGSGTAGTKTITFTTNANEYYCRISVKGLATVTDFATKCTFEIVT